MQQKPPNNALVSDVCAAALRAFYNAPQRERWAAERSARASPSEAGVTNENQRWRSE
jgi:hypothetical protein